MGGYELRISTAAIYYDDSGQFAQRHACRIRRLGMRIRLGNAPGHCGKNSPGENVVEHGTVHSTRQHAVTLPG